MTPTLEELAARVESASADQQATLLEEAWTALAEASPAFRRFACYTATGFESNADKFMMALDAHAYESAALMLVPEGFDWVVGSTNGGLTVHAEVGDRDMRFAATPALAITAASLRAQAKEVG